MAVKTASKRKIKSFDVGTQDEVLNEVLSAGKKNLAYKEGSVIPYEQYLIENEPLIIEEPVDSILSDSVANNCEFKPKYSIKSYKVQPFFKSFKKR